MEFFDDHDGSVVFLDIDGVLVKPRSMREARRNTAFCRNAVAVFRAACRAAGARIVVSSSWRSYPDMPGLLVDAWPDVPLHEDWRTVTWDDLEDADRALPVRGAEIREWLFRHPECRRYAIVDDANCRLPSQRRHMVLVDGSRGFDSSDAARMARALAVVREMTMGELWPDVPVGP